MVIDIYDLAKGLTRARADLNEAERPIDKRLALARLDGMCDAAHRLGMGMTPDHIKTVIVEATRDITTRPGPYGAKRAAWHEIWVAKVERAIRPLAPASWEVNKV